MQDNCKFKGTDKIIFYVAPPKDGDKLSSFELKVLGLVKELGQASINELLASIRPDYKDYPTFKDPKKATIRERFKMVKHVWKTLIILKDMASAIKTLKKHDCVRTASTIKGE